MNYNPKPREVKENIEQKLLRLFGTTPADATNEQVYKAVANTVKDILADKRAHFSERVKKTGEKQVYYMCMEFLLGRSLKSNLYNLGLVDAYSEALEKMGLELESLYDCEPDAGLGNGGLGRLAACFMDSLASLEYPANGFSILYEYGLFKQKIVDGLQVELPDVWLPGGEVWLEPRTDRIFTVRLGGRVKENWKDGHLEILYEGADEIEAVPYDMMISGGDSEGVSRLRLWRARDTRNFNMGLFTQGQYTRALEESNNAEIISKVLYPSDNHTEGKMLRLTQQYFLTSASVQNIIRDHMAVYGNIETLPDKVAIHINDTHPALVIPELMRILMDEYFLPWEKAWDITVRTVSYTNHTVMPEALEKWNEDIFGLKLPRIHMIVKEINERFSREAWDAFPGNWNRISGMSVLSYGQVNMANLAVIGSHSVNGVSKLHSQILTESIFKSFYRMYPDRFTNVTNGVAHRRWLCYSNPRLAALLDECIGTGYRKDPEELADFAKYADDSAVLERLRSIKHENKKDFSNFFSKRTGVSIDTHSVFDVQIKRLHEYKRQLLNVLNIIGIYLDLCDNPNLDVRPRTYIFGAKAAPGYQMAKRIIQLICMLSREIEQTPGVRDKLKVVFLENYDVTTAEALIPAAEISEQLSLAGKEASGTGCMKLMLNGALTIGTLDGANVEMLEAVGKDNIFIFGLTSNEVEELWLSGYNSALYYARNERLHRIVDRINKGFAGESFSDIVQYLISGHGISDPYMCLADFESYHQAQEQAFAVFADREEWSRRSLINIAKGGHFAADRAVTEYADRIWHIHSLAGRATE
ncbi:MAG: glycogen/starch/alpha-glucan phosphorylase [Eubacteriales bacterium]|nr:glycogen/starch/alpha-glucan phosphorylase [Eubacteriales bacterium]